MYLTMTSTSLHYYYAANHDREIIAGSVPYLDNPPFIFAVPVATTNGVGSQRYVEDGASVVMTSKSNTFFSANNVLVHQQLSTGDCYGVLVVCTVAVGIFIS